MALPSLCLVRHPVSMAEFVALLKSTSGSSTGICFGWQLMVGKLIVVLSQASEGTYVRVGSV